ncbi:MAG: hypothetical protein ACREGC_03810, partial [Minisyncoccia bacterium]
LQDCTMPFLVFIWRIEMTIGNHPAKLAFQETLMKILLQSNERGQLQHALAAMAETIQYGLVCHGSKSDIPHADSLELIMRAVAGDISGDRSSYVASKLTIGYESLMRNLE